MIKPPKKTEILVLVWKRQVGKCLVAGTNIFLPDGSYIPVEQLSDQSVLSYNGKNITPYPSHSWNNGYASCLRIKGLRDIDCTTNHPFLTPDGYKEAKDLKVGDRIALCRQLPDTNKEILSDDDLIYLAYMITEGTLGVYDGFFNCRFTNTDPDILSEWKGIVKNFSQDKITYYVKNPYYRDLLIKLGLQGTKSGNKFIPKVVFQSSTRQIAIFLSKMINGDGNINKKNIEYTSKSYQLVKDLSYLFLRIGMVGSIRTRLINGETYYSMLFSSSITLNNAKKWLRLCTYKQKILDEIHPIGHDHLDTFPLNLAEYCHRNNIGIHEFEKKTGLIMTYDNRSLTMEKIAKIQLYYDLKLDTEHIYWDTIKEIEDIGIHETYATEVDETHSYITNGYITHNTEACASLIAALMERYPGAQIGIMSNTADNAEKFVLRVKFFLQNSPFKNDIDVCKSDRIYLKNGSRLFSFGQTENIRGNSLWWLFIDEAAQFDDKLLEGAAFPTVQAAGVQRKFGLPSIILISTPRGKRGSFFKHYDQGIKSRQIGCRNCKSIFPRSFFNISRWDRNHLPELPACPHCKENDYEYVEGKIAVIHPDKYYHPFKTEEQLRQEVEEAGNTPMAEQELLGEFVEDGNGLYKEEWLLKSTDETLRNIMFLQRQKYYMSVDMGRTNDATVICIGHLNGNDERILDYTERFPGKGNQEYALMRYWILRQIVFWKPAVLIPDATGMGDAVAEQLKYDIVALRTKGIEGEYTTKDPSGREIKHNFSFPRIKELRTMIYKNKKEHEGFWFEANSKKDLVESSVEDLARGRCKIPGRMIDIHTQHLWEELLSFAFEYSLSGKVIYGVQNEHDDCVMSYALLLWAMKVHPYVQSKPKLGQSDEYVLPNI